MEQQTYIIYILQNRSRFSVGISLNIQYLLFKTDIKNEDANRL